jgi:hypothetical protein
MRPRRLLGNGRRIKSLIRKRREWLGIKHEERPLKKEKLQELPVEQEIPDVNQK